MRKLSSANLTNKKVIVRVDFNVPLKGKKITDDARIVGALPTIKYILSKKPKQLILMSHLGRPKGEAKPEYSLNPVAKRLEKLLKRKVAFEKKWYDKGIGKGKIVLLENLRFYNEEKKNDPNFAKKLASLADIYVNDAFGTSHRAHASVEGITKYLRSYPGLLVAKEISKLSILNKPTKPYLAIIGGGKADKIDLIESLLKKVTKLALGGVLANLIIQANGQKIGTSKTDPNGINAAKKLSKNKKIIKIEDVVVARSINEPGTQVKVNMVPANTAILDLGPETTDKIIDEIKKSKTIFFGGPIGVYESEEFCIGTKRIVEALAKSKAKVIVGGGDSAAVVHNMNLQSKMTHVSTGGGASLAFIQGQKLPAFVALEKNTKLKF